MSRHLSDKEQKPWMKDFKPSCCDVSAPLSQAKQEDISVQKNISLAFLRGVCLGILSSPCLGRK